MTERFLALGFVESNSTDYSTLFSISERGSPRIADFRLVSGRRKETRGIVLNTVGRENDEGIIGACRHFS